MCLISIFFCIFAPCDWINRVFIAEKITEIPTGSCLTSAAVSRNSPGKHREQRCKRLHRGYKTIRLRWETT